jgi:hypothetical protein
MVRSFFAQILDTGGNIFTETNTEDGMAAQRTDRTAFLILQFLSSVVLCWAIRTITMRRTSTSGEAITSCQEVSAPTSFRKQMHDQLGEDVSSHNLSDIRTASPQPSIEANISTGRQHKRSSKVKIVRGTLVIDKGRAGGVNDTRLEHTGTSFGALFNV